MEKGAEKATTLIEYAGEKQRSKTEPTAEDAKVHFNIKHLSTVITLNIMLYSNYYP